MPAAQLAVPVPGAAPTDTLESVRLRLPESTVEVCGAIALTSARTLDEVIADLLARALELADAAYVIDRAADKRIRGLLGGRVDSAPKLIDMIERLKTAHVGGMRVELPLAVQEQIQWAAHSLGKSVEEVGPQLILDAVRERFRA